MRKMIPILIFFTLGIYLLWNPKVLMKKNISSIPKEKSRKIASDEKEQKPVTTLAASKPKTQWLSPELKVFAELKNCYETQNCAYPQTDPRSYEVALGQDIAKRLKIFEKSHRNHPEMEKIRQQLALDFIHNFDGFVQEAALEIFAHLPISPENLTAIVEGLNGTPDAVVLKQALPELARYMNSAYENQVHTFLSSTISQGAHFSAQVASENIGPFVTKNSYPIYEKAQQQMTLGSESLRQLSSALKEYRRQETGA